MLARSCHTIPEPPTRLRDIQDEREQLDQADDYSDHDRDDGKHRMAMWSFARAVEV